MMEGRSEATRQASVSTVANEANASVQETKERLSALKSQIAFAHQCLSLLQNQLNHAADTLGILQDQVTKAQETMEHLVLPEVPRSPRVQGRSVPTVAHCCNPPGSAASVTSSVNGQVVLVQNTEGQKVYAVRGVHLPREGEVAHCGDTNPVRSSMQPVVVPCQCPVCVTVHAGGTQNFVNSAPSHKAQDSAETPSASHAPSHDEVQVASYPPPVSSHNDTQTCAPKQGELTVKTEPQTSLLNTHQPAEQGLSLGQPCSSCISEGGIVPKVESTSPMAHQLLQVIDVLQSADDEVEEIKSGTSSTPSTPLSASQGSSPGMSHFQRFTEHVPMGSRVRHTVSPGPSTYTRHRASPRRNRKQNMMFKYETSPAGTGKPVTNTETLALDLMRVPRPVLASSLPPEFLVVPATNYDQDSPDPSTATPSKRAEGSGVSSDNDGAAAVKSLAAIAAEISTTGFPSSKAPDCEVIDRGSEDLAIVTSVTQSTREESAGLSYHGHAPVPINHYARDTRNVLSRTSSAATGSYTLTGSSSRGLLSTPTSSGSSLQNGLQYVASSRGQSTCTETATITTSSLVPTKTSEMPGAEPAPGQLTTVTEQALEARSQSITVLPMSSLGSSAKSRSANTGSKRPIILSRRSSRDQNLPEGVVVLVPTIEDAKRLIASTGGNSKGSTPVLVPQHMINDIHSNNRDRSHEGALISSPTKRHFESVSPFSSCGSPAKRQSTTESL